METFTFPYHSVIDRYPDSSPAMQFGKGYRFVSKPRGPDQIAFVLNFPHMWFFETITNPGQPTETRTVNNTKEPLRNMQRIIEFYERHGLYKKFVYPHPRRGNLVVRFQKPLEVPEVERDMMGKTESFKIEMILEP